MRANQVRLCLATVAYIVMRALRQFGLAETEMAQAQCDTMRVRLLKIGAVIRVTVRRIWLAFSEAYPWQELFRQVYAKVRALQPAAEPAVNGSG
jgi:DDE family transposase